MWATENTYPGQSKLPPPPMPPAPLPLPYEHMRHKPIAEGCTSTGTQDTIVSNHFDPIKQ